LHRTRIFQGCGLKLQSLEGQEGTGPTPRRYLATPAHALFGSSVILYSEKYLFAHPSASHIPPAWKLGLNCPCIRLDMSSTVHCAIVLPAQTTEDSGGLRFSNQLEEGWKDRE
jgi:hypothetical protein